MYVPTIIEGYVAEVTYIIMCTCKINVHTNMQKIAITRYINNLVATYMLLESINSSLNHQVIGKLHTYE